MSRGVTIAIVFYVGLFCGDYLSRWIQRESDRQRAEIFQRSLLAPPPKIVPGAPLPRSIVFSHEPLIAERR